MPASPSAPSSSPNFTQYGPAWALAACLALAAPAWIAFNLPPSSTFLNQAAALVGWGAFLALMCFALPARRGRHAGGSWALQGALALTALAALASPAWTNLPSSLSLSAAGMIGAAALAAATGHTLARDGLGTAAFRAMCIGLLVAGLASSLIGVAQVYAPQLCDGDWLAASSITGIAVGNLRQSNHLSSLLLWSVIATLWLSEHRVLSRYSAAGLALLLMFGVVLSGSRTGALGAGMLALWGLLDRRLSSPARLMLVLAPVAYGLLWAGSAAWAHHSQGVFGAEARFSTAGDLSSSRFGIWSNTLELIRLHPLVGVGWGEFNFAWTLTPFPGRPVAFFDHTHNLPLQLAVELGLPLATVVLALLLGALGVGLVSAFKAGSGDAGPAAPMQRAAVAMVLMVAVHSLLEYPLWYAYFLLPAAFALGLCLAAPDAAGERAGYSAGDTVPTGLLVSSTRRSAQTPPRGLLWASLLLVAGGLYSVWDYRQVVVIFAPPAKAQSLAQRIADGQGSTFFSHHADYAAATTADPPSRALGAFVAAPHYLLDVRLMTAWARALDESGNVDRARYVAQRLKEFRNQQAKDFFAPCADTAVPVSKQPFQCQAPGRALNYLDFR